jgi:hypothetical protein
MRCFHDASTSADDDDAAAAAGLVTSLAAWIPASLIPSSVTSALRFLDRNRGGTYDDSETGATVDDDSDRGGDSDADGGGVWRSGVDTLPRIGGGGGGGGGKGGADDDVAASMTKFASRLAVGLYKLNSVVTHSLKAPDFNRCAYEVENLVSKFCFQIQLATLHRGCVDGAAFQKRWG